MVMDSVVRALCTCHVVIGGDYQTPSPDDDGVLATYIEIFDIAAKTWTKGPQVKWTREPFCVGVIGTKIYIIGGQV
jgi:hypothetical protein